MENRKGAKKYTFYDGPPFATGLPHYGHILAMTIKDAITRLKTMQGFYVPRRLGWDTHGLPVEYELEKEWGIKVEETFPELSFNFVAKAKTNDGKEVVLKIGFPGDKQFLSEAQTLKIYNGQGSIKLLKENLDDFVLLLERCIPGKALYSLNDEEKETLIFTQVCKKIWKAPPIEEVMNSYQAFLEKQQ